MKYGKSKKNCGDTSAASGTMLMGKSPSVRKPGKAGFSIPNDPGKTTYKR